MKSNNLKKIMALADASNETIGKVCVINDTDFKIIESSEVENSRKNLARNKNVEASCSEREGLGAHNLTSGDFDRRNFQKRWSSAYDAENPWVTIDLGEVTTFNEVVIQWERRNVTSYEIQGSNAKKGWTVIKELGRPQELREIVNFEEQEFRYLKVQIKTYGEDGLAGEIPWLIVSMYEVEVYHNRNVEALENKRIEFNKAVLERDRIRNIKKEDKIISIRATKSKLVQIDLGQAKVAKEPLFKWDRRIINRDKYKFLNREGKEKRDYAWGKSPPYALI